MLRILLLSLALGFSQSFNVADEAVMDKVAKEELKEHQQPEEELEEHQEPEEELKDHLEPEGEEDMPWWIEEDVAEENKEEETRVEVRHGGGCYNGSCCPSSGSFCHYLKGTCYHSSASTSHCDYVSSKDSRHCQHKDCKCCIECKKDWETSQCRAVKGHCRKDNKCLMHEYPDVFNPCVPHGCTCCRRCQTSRECRNGSPSPGFCVRDVAYFTRHHAIFSDPSARCSEDEPCGCVRYCATEKKCASAKGYCVKKSVPCKSNYIKFNCGCRDSENCSCCVPMSAKEFPMFQCNK